MNLHHVLKFKMLDIVHDFLIIAVLKGELNETQFKLAPPGSHGLN